MPFVLEIRWADVWMTCDVYILFNSIPVISGRESDIERLCADTRVKKVLKYKRAMKHTIPPSPFSFEL